APITVCIVGLGFCMAGIYPTANSMIGDLCRQYPLAMSVLLTITGIGAIVMPSVVGWVAEGFGITAGMYAILAAVIVDVALIFGNALFCREKKN
ncbi:MAG: MFS transporter, partial [Faecalibacterium sp.]|nr:MFS transporter [Faecalibacterium sp.]